MKNRPTRKKEVKMISISKKSLDNKLTNYHAKGFDTGYLRALSLVLEKSSDTQAIAHLVLTWMEISDTPNELLDEVLLISDEESEVFKNNIHKIIWALKECEVEESENIIGWLKSNLELVDQ